ncbi:cysteine-rich RLK (RECEPTOR-like protein kinase) 19 [Actinidia rufa]|uniref:Cysteine-rich RLK (RECEPTOR-like protein kinase) 19 n=1 Tax=Actinidia rufa TaxID=165716 RepID=A0A7J0EZ79_9ERIC|nr:cysteine-rich RLK (RECEPTOR-like protein kinase) 19 [Actinidia rufa]
MMQLSCCFFLFTLSLLSIIISETKAARELRFLTCPNNTVTYTPNSTYAANLKAVSWPLSPPTPTDPAGFHNSTAGRGTPDTAYGLFLCRGDLSPADCLDCVTFASTEVVERCPSSKLATIWYDDCMLRYSNQSIFAVPELTGGAFLWNIQNVTDVSRFEDVLGELLRDVVNRASDCEVGRILFPSCNVRYETYPFYNVTAFAAPPPPVVPPPPPPPPSTGNGGLSSQVLIAIIASDLRGHSAFHRRLLLAAKEKDEEI